MADRGRYIAAALTAVRAFLLSGEPAQPPLASFATWSNWVRSAIVAFGYGDPVRTVATAVADDPDRQALGALLAAWWAAFGGSEISVADVIKRASERDTTGAYTATGLARRDHGGSGQQRRRHQRQPARQVAAQASRPQAQQSRSAQRWDTATNTSRWAVAQC